ncbi:spondin domain-containing protein [Balneicella halophila]|nr:spondin domain-containing protein [Balneicella halophila]
MKRILVWALVILTFTACDDDDDKQTVVELKHDMRYTFNVTVRGQWTEETHPNYFPGDAGFGKVVAITQKDDNVLFQKGKKAPTWMKSYFENEDTSNFTNYFTEQKTNNRVSGFTSSEGCPATGSSEFEITTEGRFNKFSMITKLSPSADWFIGVNNIDLDGLAYGGSATFITSVWDAGLFSGEYHSNKGSATNESIETYKGAPLSYPDGGINNFAIVTIKLKSSEKIEP